MIHLVYTIIRRQSLSVDQLRGDKRILLLSLTSFFFFRFVYTLRAEDSEKLKREHTQFPNSEFSSSAYNKCGPIIPLLGRPVVKQQRKLTIREY